MSAETLLDVFVPPEGMVGHSAALVAMTGAEDFLEDAVQRFTGLRPRQRAELGSVLVYLMLDGHSSTSRKEVFPPGRIPGLHEFQPRSIDAGSLLHAKVTLLAFAPSRTGAPIHLRLAVLTANFTHTSARHQLELVWLVDVPLDGTARPEDCADVVAGGAFVEALLARRFHRDEQGLAPKQRRLTARLDELLTAASSLETNHKSRFINSMDRPLYDQIQERFEKALKKTPKNLLLCGSGFYEAPTNGKKKPEVLGKLESINVFTSQPKRVALVNPSEAGAVAAWARNKHPDGKGNRDGWSIALPSDSLNYKRFLHSKFVYAGWWREKNLSNGYLYIGSGNLSKRGLLSSEKSPLIEKGKKVWNVETGVVFAVPESMNGETIKRRLFWAIDDEASLDGAQLIVGRVGDAPEDEPLIEAPPILSATIETPLPRRLRLLWRDDATVKRASISWTGRDWFDVRQAEDVALKDDENLTALQVRDGSDRMWTVPVVDAAGRVGWQPPRFDTYADALAALLDFPIRPVEATDDDRDGEDDGGTKRTGAGEALEQEKSYALHAAAELVEKVAALQTALPESMLDDWLDHLDRMFRASFPETLIATWRAHRLDIFAHLRQPALRSPHLTEKQRVRYFEVLDDAARAWWLR